MFCYLLTYLLSPNACLCQVLPRLAFGAGQVRLVSQALPEGEVGSKFYVFALLFQARSKARHILFVAVSFFLAFLNDPVAIIFHYFFAGATGGTGSSGPPGAPGVGGLYSELL